MTAWQWFAREEMDRCCPIPRLTKGTGAFVNRLFVNFSNLQLMLAKVPVPFVNIMPVTPSWSSIEAQLGATDVISYKDGDVVEQIMELNGGCCDVTMVCGGPASVVWQAMALTRGGGELCSLNAYYDDVVIPVPAWNSGMKTVNFRGWQVTGGREIYERYLKMISLGKFDPAPLATHVFHGYDQMEECLWAKKQRDCLKPVCLLD